MAFLCQQIKQVLTWQMIYPGLYLVGLILLSHWVKS